jgi:hypothetical protein
MTLSDVKEITSGLKSEDYHYSLELAEGHMNVLNLELLYTDKNMECVVEIIAESGQTSKKANGWSLSRRWRGLSG